jgi:hypothetical protein
MKRFFSRTEFLSVLEASPFSVLLKCFAEIHQSKQTLGRFPPSKSLKLISSVKVALLL